eukprot:312272-Pelagomonas_calceolata.AAC.1
MAAVIFRVANKKLEQASTALSLTAKKWLSPMLLELLTPYVELNEKRKKSLRRPQAACIKERSCQAEKVTQP